MIALDTSTLVRQVAREYGFRDLLSIQALYDAANVTATYTGPFLLLSVNNMREPVKRELAGNSRARLLGIARGGKPMLDVMEVWEPETVEDHGVHVAMSRVLLEKMIRDLERRQRNSDFPKDRAVGIPTTRYRNKDIDDAEIEGAYAAGMAYFNACGAALPWERNVILDPCHHATLHKMLAGMCLDTRFSSRQIFFDATHDDVRQVEKQGHMLHRDCRQLVSGGMLRYGSVLGREETMRAIEDTLNGPYSSTERIVDGRPDRRLAAELHHRVDPDRLDPVWKDEWLRIAAKELNQRVLLAQAKELAGLSPAQVAFKLAEAPRIFLGAMHHFLTEDPRTDPAFASVMNVWVPRPRPGQEYKPLRHTVHPSRTVVSRPAASRMLAANAALSGFAFRERVRPRW